jgi:hypothetical protein
MRLDVQVKARRLASVAHVRDLLTGCGCLTGADVGLIDVAVDRDG